MITVSLFASPIVHRPQQSPYMSPVMAAINTAGFVDKAYPVQDTLFFKIQGDPKSIQEASTVVQTIVKRHGSSNFKFASTEQEAEELWQNRKYALMSSLAAHPGMRCWTTDVWYGILSFIFFFFHLMGNLVCPYHACLNSYTRPRRI